METAFVVLRDSAWPVTVLVVALLFRAELRRAIGRLITVHYGEFQASFEKQLKRAESRPHRRGRHPQPKAAAPGQVIHEVDRPAPAAGGPSVATGVEATYRLAIVSPREAIAQAWVWLERLVLDAARALATGAERLEVLSWEKALGRLVDRGVLPIDLRSKLDELRGLAAKLAAIPATEPAITSDQARRYIDLARELSGQLGHLRLPG